MTADRRPLGGGPTGYPIIPPPIHRPRATEEQPTRADATASGMVWLGDLAGWEVGVMERSDGAHVLGLYHRCGWAEPLRANGIQDDVTTNLANILTYLTVEILPTHECHRYGPQGHRNGPIVDGPPLNW
jgi:hypothetical protein